MKFTPPSSFLSFRRAGGRIHEGKAQGVLVLEGAKGRVERCDIWGNALAGVHIQGQGTEPAVVDCK